MAALIDDEIIIKNKLDRFYVKYNFKVVCDISKIETGISQLEDLADSYMSIHLKLRREMGDQAYEETYADYEKTVAMTTEWIGLAMEKIRNRELNVIRTEEKYFRNRIESEIALMYEEKSPFLEGLEKNLVVARNLRKGYSEIFMKIEAQGQSFLDEFADTFQKLMVSLDELVLNTNKKIHEIKMAEFADKSNDEAIQNEKLARVRKEKVMMCKSIYDNICDRLRSLELKCKSDVKTFSNPDLLNEKRDTKTLDSDFNQVLDKFIKLTEHNPDEFVETRGFLKIVTQRKENLKVSIATYKEKLIKEISERDLSEEKLKNASILGIKLPKFKGYDSDLDIYSFKSEFEKLISPRVFIHLQSDYLKNNYLEGQALQLVREIDSLDDIWARLKTSFGNVGTLLSKKLDKLESGVPIWKIKSDEKLIESILKLRNSMMELRSLAVKHAIEQNLFHTSNLAKVLNLLGNKRHLEITKKQIGHEKSDREKWDDIIDFLDNELKITEQMLMFKKCNLKGDNISNKSEKSGSTGDKSYNSSVETVKKCLICEKTDHIPTITKKGKSVVNYFACEKFAKMTPKERLDELRNKKLCFQCLTPGWKIGHEGRCFDKYKCPNDHKNDTKKPHILVCDQHKSSQLNIDLLKEYKSKCITGSSNKYAEFSVNIDNAFHVDSHLASQSYEVQGDEDMAIYMLQTISIKGRKLNLFFDNGCGDMVIKKSAVDFLEKHGLAKNVVKGPLVLSGVAEQQSICQYGRYKITLPLHNGTEVDLCGICIDTITSTFPTFPLDQVEKDLKQDYVRKGGDLANFPKLPPSVGGDTDIMLGIQYLKYFPTEIHRMENGLALFESPFVSHDKSRGTVGGPHKSFNLLNKNLSNHVDVTAFFSRTISDSKNYFQQNLDAGILDIANSKIFYDVTTGTTEKISKGQNLARGESYDEFVCATSEKFTNETYANRNFANKRVPKIVKRFEEVEKAGTELSYRCVKCRGCSNCKRSAKIESISLQEEMEQGIINKSVTVNLMVQYTSAFLPFLCDPTKKLVENYSISEKIYFNQIKRLDSKSSTDKNDVIEAFKKLIDLGFISKYDSLSEQEKRLIDNSPVRYYIPWTAVWNSNSLSTPCRPVFNASCPTKTGYSLNDLLPKGKNSLNKLVQIFIRWLIYTCAFHSDIQKMYNTIKLVPEHWCYQLCLFENDLNINVKPLVHVIKTLIYGVRSSGNQAEKAVRDTGDLNKEEYPRVNEIIQDDLYMDDCLSGEESYELCKVVTDSLQIVLNMGGFHLKGITFSGFDPPTHLCNDNKSINVAGLKWFPKSDLISLNISDLNFGKKVRGKKSNSHLGSKQFTRRDCAGRVGEIFDLVGRFTPLIAEFKLDLHELCTRKLDWDDVIPPDLVDKWECNFETISKMGEVRFKRCIVPDDAINLDMETIEMADASLVMACAVIYVRFKRKNGLYSCQLIFAKSKIVPEGMSIHRAELLAAELNSITGHVVNISLRKYIKTRIHLTDNQIALSWICNPKLPLKPWPRNRVVEICRLTDRNDWFHIEGKNMTADIGTRRGAKVSDVLDNSTWVCCMEWAKYENHTFPIQSFKDIKLSKDELKNHDDEILKLDVSDAEWINKQLSHMCCENYPVINTKASTEIGERYKFSDYIVDPNKYRFRKVVRILGLVYLFIRNLQRRVGMSNSIVVSENGIPEQLNFCNDRYLVTKSSNDFPFVCKQGLAIELTANYLHESLNYYYKKASLEIKNFYDVKHYKKISNEKLGILYYTGRILPSQQINNKLNLSDVCLDLNMTSFCVPLIDKFSPLAYAIINEVHWYDDDCKHSGVESVLRSVLKISYIFEGRSLVKMFRNECPRCKYLNKKAIEVAMGPKTCNELTIAPAFYTCQCDLFGPYNAYSNANKRATIKVWFVIFCCCVTGAVDIKVMEDYGTTSFVLAFIRFSCKVGYPRKVLPDPGSQLVKGCESMLITFTDVKNKLHEYGVDYELCPVGAHYMHGKVERKIKHVKESFSKELHKNRLSIIQWETIGDRIANTINNLPIALGNISQDLENLDLLTPNRLMLARNNSRCPAGPLKVSEDVGQIIKHNNAIFEAWFKAWLISYVPSLMFQPKWFKSDCDPKKGDVVLFLKSDKEFDKIYQYGIISEVNIGRDGKIRQITVQYQNPSENVKRYTIRGTRDIVVIHPHNELGLIRELNVLAASLT